MCYTRKHLESHYKQASKGIRFITPHYEELFRIKDGAKIKKAFSEKDYEEYVARYIDDYHVELAYDITGRYACTYHICELAEIARKNEYTIIPVSEKDIITKEYQRKQVV